MLFSWNFSLNLSDLWTRQLANQSFEKSATLDNIYWPQLFKRRITLSTGEISVSWITQLLVSLIHWVVIYLVNSTIQLLNRAGPDVLIFEWTEKSFAHEHCKAANFVHFLLTYFGDLYMYLILVNVEHIALEVQFYPWVPYFLKSPTT